MDAEKELESIILKYGLDSRPVLLKERLAAIFGQILEEAVKKYGPRVVIRGMKADVDSRQILELVESKARIMAVMDRRPFAETIRLSGGIEVPFLRSEELDTMDCDFCFINSFYRYGEMVREMEGLLKKKGIGLVVPYHEARSAHSFCAAKPYEQYGGERDFSHNRLQEALAGFRSRPGRDTFERLLGVCLSLKDFVSFYRYCDEGKNIPDGIDYLDGLRGEVDSLLRRIKKELGLRGKREGSPKDIVWHWIDQLGYEELELMPELNKRLRTEGLFFEQAFTVTPYTKPTVQMIFWTEFRGNGIGSSHVGRYKRKRLNESPIYRSVIDAGYEFQCHGYAKKILDDQFDGTELCETSVAASVHYWKAVESLLSADKPVFSIIHVLEETHEPFVSPEVDFSRNAYEFQHSYEFVKDKIRMSAEFADQQISFYSSLMGDQTACIYMSDHGKWEDIDRRRYEDKVMHTFLGITGAGIKGTVSRMFSYEHFLRLIQWILEMAGPEWMFFCDVPIYSQNIKYWIEKRGAESQGILNGYMGIRTIKEKYVLTDDGREAYFCLPDEERDRSGHESCRERLHDLRQACENYIQSVEHC